MWGFVTIAWKARGRGSEPCAWPKWGQAFPHSVGLKQLDGNRGTKVVGKLPPQIVFG